MGVQCLMSNAEVQGKARTEKFQKFEIPRDLKNLKADG